MHINSILQSYYGITNATVTTLEGYDSTNYKVKSENETYVLKQNSYSEETLGILKAENEIFKGLQVLKDYDFPIAISSVQNKTVVVVEDQIFRLLSFVEGAFLGDVEHTAELLHSFGIFLAKMGNQIHSTYQSALVGKETQWDLKHFKTNHSYLKYISNPKDRSLVDYFFLQFDAHISPIAYQLRTGLIHNDGNDWNVLTKHGKVSEIIDFVYK